MTLIEQLQHPEKNLRQQAALQLAGQVEALGALIQALRVETDLFVRETLTWVLVGLRPASLPPLIDLLHDPNPEARHAAAHVLGKIADPQATDALINTLQDCEPKVVLKAAFSLGQIGERRAIPALLTLLGSDHLELQTTLGTVLEKFGTVSVPPLVGALQDGSWQVRAQAAEMLALFEDEEAAWALIHALGDTAWQVRFAATTALLGHREAVGSLKPLQADPDLRIRALVSNLH
jgi:HEAT repeat protein